MDEDRTLFMVLSNAVEGKEAEFDDWYDRVHIHEVLATPGMVSAQRYDLVEPEISRAQGNKPAHRKLAIYEMKGDVDTVMGRISEAATSGAMSISDSLDLETVVMSFWAPHGPRIEA